MLISLISLGPQHPQSLGTGAYDPLRSAAGVGPWGAVCLPGPGVCLWSVRVCAEPVSSSCPPVRACLCICPVLSGVRGSQQARVCDSESQLLPSVHRRLPKAVRLVRVCVSVCVWPRVCLAAFLAASEGLLG